MHVFFNELLNPLGSLMFNINIVLIISDYKRTKVMMDLIVQYW